MKFNYKQFWNSLVLYKEGILIGAVTGILAAYYITAKGYDFNQLVLAGSGLFDSMFSRSAPLELAKYKLYTAFAIMGGTLGFAADMLIDRFNLIRGR